MKQKQSLKITPFQTKPLSLTNSGNLSIFFLGVGSAFSHRFFQTNLILIKGNTSVFVDFGTMAPRAIKARGLDIAHVSTLLLTHSHADHIGGMEEVAMKSRYFYQKKPQLLITEPYSRFLWQESLSGGCKYSEKKAPGTYLSLEDFFELTYFQPAKDLKDSFDNRKYYTLQIGDINLFLFQTKHIPSNGVEIEDFQLSYGLVIDHKVVFTSDTLFDADLLAFLEKNFPLEYLFHDCQFYNGGVHASYEQLQTLPPQLREKMFLVHYGDDPSVKDPVKDGFRGFVKEGHFYNFDF